MYGVHAKSMSIGKRFGHGFKTSHVVLRMDANYIKRFIFIIELMPKLDTQKKKSSLFFL